MFCLEWMSFVTMGCQPTWFPVKDFCLSFHMVVLWGKTFRMMGWCYQPCVWIHLWWWWSARPVRSGYTWSFLNSWSFTLKAPHISISLNRAKIFRCRGSLFRRFQKFHFFLFLNLYRDNTFFPEHLVMLILLYLF